MIGRLACSACDRGDKDCISEAELDACLREGWADITPIQTYEQSLETFEPEEAPPDFDVTAWYTHLGTCPSCREAE